MNIYLIHFNNRFEMGTAVVIASKLQEAQGWINTYRGRNSVWDDYTSATLLGTAVDHANQVPHVVTLTTTAKYPR